MVYPSQKTTTKATEIIGDEEVTVTIETGWIGDTAYRRIDCGKKYGQIYMQMQCKNPLFETDQKGEDGPNETVS